MAEDALVISLDTKPAVDSLKSLTNFVNQVSGALSSLPQGLPKGLNNDFKSLRVSMSGLKPVVDDLNKFSSALRRIPDPVNVNKIHASFHNLMKLSYQLNNVIGVSQGLSEAGKNINVFSKSLLSLNKLDGIIPKIRALRGAISVLISSFAQLTDRSDFAKFYALSNALERVARTVVTLRTQAPKLANSLLGLSNSARKASGEIESFSDNLRLFSGGWRTMITALLGGTVIYTIIGALKSIVKETIDFEFMLRRINTMARQTESGLMDMSNTMLEVSSSYGLAKQDVTEAMYAITSATIKGAGALEVLKASAEFAVAGATDVRSSAELVSRVIMAYGKSAYSAAEVTDIMFKTIERGITTAEELNHDLGKVLATAASAKQSFQEIGAAVATLTARGLQTNIAVTSLNALLLKLNSNTKKLNPLFRRLGYESSSAALQTLGLAKTMQILETATGGSVDGLIKLGFNYRDVRAATILANDAGNVYKKNLKEIADATKYTGSSTEAFKEIQKSFSQQLAEISKGLGSFAIKVVDAFGTFSGLRFVIGFINSLKQLKNSSNALVSTFAEVTSMLGKTGVKLVSIGVGISAIIAGISLLKSLIGAAIVKIMIPAFVSLASGIQRAVVAVRALNTAMIASKALALTNPYVLLATTLATLFTVSVVKAQSEIKKLQKEIANTTLDELTRSLEDFSKSAVNVQTDLERILKLADIDAQLSRLQSLKSVLGEDNKELNKTIMNYTTLYEKINTTNVGLDDQLEKLQELREELSKIKEDNFVKSLGDPAKLQYYSRQLEKYKDDLSKLTPGTTEYVLTQIEIEKLNGTLSELVTKSESFNKNMAEAFSKLSNTSKTTTTNIGAMADEYDKILKSLEGSVSGGLLDRLALDKLAGTSPEDMKSLFDDIQKELATSAAASAKAVADANFGAVSSMLRDSFGIVDLNFKSSDIDVVKSVSEDMNRAVTAAKAYEDAIASGEKDVKKLLGLRLSYMESIATVQQNTTGKVSESLSNEINKIKSVADGYVDLTTKVEEARNSIGKGNIYRASIVGQLETGLADAFSIKRSTYWTGGEVQAQTNLATGLGAFNRVTGFSRDISTFWRESGLYTEEFKKYLDDSLRTLVTTDSVTKTIANSLIITPQLNQAETSIQNVNKALERMAEIVKDMPSITEEVKQSAFGFLPKPQQISEVKSKLANLISSFKTATAAGKTKLAEYLQRDIYKTAGTLQGLVGSASSGNLTSSTVTALEVGSQAAFDILAKTSKQDYIESISTNVSSLLNVVTSMARDQFNKSTTSLEVVTE